MTAPLAKYAGRKVALRLLLQKAYQAAKRWGTEFGKGLWLFVLATWMPVAVWALISPHVSGNAETILYIGAAGWGLVSTIIGWFGILHNPELDAGWKWNWGLAVIVFLVLFPLGGLLIVFGWPM